jgi:GNAT superfamily N-acetyltransferase
MAIELRPYAHPTDYRLVSDFLIANHLPGNLDGNWLQPRWEYMHSHPSLDETVLDRIGLWELDGRLVGALNYEVGLGTAYPQLDREHPELRAAMLSHAQSHLAVDLADGRRQVTLYLHERDAEFASLAAAAGFVAQAGREPMSCYLVPAEPERPQTPPGFRVKSLQEENSLSKIHRVMWRGFNHPGEPPEEGIAWRIKMQSGPSFRHDLNIVVEAPGGDFAAYAGLWLEPVNRVAYVEPVATDPAYRRMGLARAAVLEGIRRCAAEGATIAYVGSNQPFYAAIGFREIAGFRAWLKRWNGPGG